MTTNSSELGKTLEDDELVEADNELADLPPIPKTNSLDAEEPVLEDDAKIQ